SSATSAAACARPSNRAATGSDRTTRPITGRPLPTSAPTSIPSADTRPRKEHAMGESYVAALIAVWEDLRAALGERFEALAPDLSNLIEAYLTARDTEAAAQAEVAVEDWIAEHAPSLDGAIRLQMILAMDTPAVSFDLESLTGRTQVDWQRI